MWKWEFSGCIFDPHGHRQEFPVTTENKFYVNDLIVEFDFISKLS